MSANDSSHRTQSTRLNFGQLPPSYSSVEPSNGTPPGPRLAPPGPSSTQSPGLRSDLENGPVPRPAPLVVISPGLALCLVIISIQAVLIICHSDALAILINLESAARRASTEKAALVAEKSALVMEREKLGRERERMKQERELWERAKEDRIPHGTFWDLISPALNCCAYGKREYWAALRNVPEGWTATDACMNTPAKVKGVDFRHPHRCSFVGGSSEIRGYWMVDWDEPDCQPWYHGCRDVVSVTCPFFVYALSS